MYVLKVYLSYFQLTKSYNDFMKGFQDSRFSKLTTRDCKRYSETLSELLNFYSPEIIRKAMGVYWIQGELKLSKWLYLFNISSDICRWFFNCFRLHPVLVILVCYFQSLQSWSNIFLPLCHLTQDCKSYSGIFGCMSFYLDLEFLVLVFGPRNGLTVCVK